MNKPIFSLSVLALSLLNINSLHAKEVIDASKNSQLIPEIITLEDSFVIGEYEIDSESFLDNEDTISRDDDNLLKNLKMRPTVSIGDAVANVSGVQNSHFGPHNGLPQIRSLSGTRVQVSENGMATSALSAISGHLPTGVNPLLAEEISVNKKSAAVLYGGQAVGGSVNVKNKQIPNAKIKEPQGFIAAAGGYNTSSDLTLSVDTSYDNNIVLHFDAMATDVSGYQVPGNSKADICYSTDSLWRMGKYGMGYNQGLARACQVRINVETTYNTPLILKKFLEEGEAYREKMGLDYGDVYKSEHPSWDKDKVHFVSNPDFDVNQPSGKTQKLISIKDYVKLKDGEMSNAHMRQLNSNFGVSYVADSGYVGMKVSNTDNEYGVPGYASIDTKTKKDNFQLPVNIKNANNEVAVEAVLKFADKEIESNKKSKVSTLVTLPIQSLPVSVKQIKANLAYSDEENNEYLGERFATSLNAKQTQARFEFSHELNKDTHGVVGVDLLQRDTGGEGRDRFLPDTKAKQQGIFALQKFNLKGVQSKLGYRYEKVDRKAIYNDSYRAHKPEDIKKRFQKDNASFNLNNYLADVRWVPVTNLTVNAAYNHSERAPEVHELFASNIHYAIVALEYGDPDLTKEVAKTWELGASYVWGDTDVKVNYFNTDYQDYIYLANTGMSKTLSTDIKEWRQDDTLISGWETELNHQLELNDYGYLNLRLFADIVKNRPKNKDSMRYKRDGNFMPNMPTSRYGVGAAWDYDNIQLGLNMTHYAIQKYKTNLLWEMDLPNYTLVDAYAGYKMSLASDNELELFLNARNLMNEKAHANNSPLKYITPIAGRSLKAGVKFSF